MTETPGADVPVRYARRTLNCGHLDLVQTGLSGRTYRIGDLAACYVCPTRPEGGYPRGTPGMREVATVRQVVDVEFVLLDTEPETPGVEWWYW